MSPNAPSTAAAARRRRRSRPALAAAAAVGVLAWLVSGFYTVDSNERGVVTRFGRLHERVSPGIHYALPWPIDRVYRPRTTEVKRIEVGFTTLGKLSSELRRSDCLTGDENILKVMLVVQYKIRAPEAYLFHAEQPHWAVERAVEAAMNGLIARLPVDNVLTTAKSELQVAAIRTAQRLLDAYDTGTTLLGGNLQVVDPPEPVKEAFKDVASAKKDKDRLRDEAQEYAGRILPQASGEAQEIVSKAQGRYAERVSRARGEAARFGSLLAEYRRAKEITRVRLFVETMERVLAQMKVIVVDERTTRVTIVE